MKATLENEAIATVEDGAAQTDWIGDLGGGLGVDQAAPHRDRVQRRQDTQQLGGDGRDGGGVTDRPPKYERQGCADGVHAVGGQRCGWSLCRASGDAVDGDRRRLGWTGSITWFRDRTRFQAAAAGLSPPFDPADRLVWEAGDAGAVRPVVPAEADPA